MKTKRGAASPRANTGTKKSKQGGKMEGLVLLIDNYDSFSYNLYQYLCELGASVKVVRNDELTVQQCEELHPTHLLISPGPGTPQSAGISMEAIKYFAGKIPILGVCLGHQSIIEVFGGKVGRACEIVHGKVSPIEHDGKGVFLGIPNNFNATRYHSLSSNGAIPADLVVSASCKSLSSDETIVQGVRHVKYQIEGLQFHPESILTEHGKEILTNFLQQQQA